ncbi:MAG: type II toxin-antitoxin system RelE/ParE family toxin [Candidatus Tenebribacter mawsonii]|nr:type II toxin-antitoxin system RelE/ParE family toxin [Candidatus Tenebribacter mawsonii]
MAKYKLKFATSVKKDFRKIPNNDVSKILKLINSLLDDPYPKNVKKLSHQNKFRIRYRNYRILYKIINNELIIYVLKISHRKDVYK